MKKLMEVLTGEKAVLLISILVLLTFFLSIAAFGIGMFKLILVMLGVI